MGKKHGIWFDLIDHIAIHDEVIEQSSWQIKSGQGEYNYQRIQKDGIDRLKQDIAFETNNGCSIEISKETLISIHNPHNGMTIYFRYNCLMPSKNYHLRYHSAHGTALTQMLDSTTNLIDTSLMGKFKRFMSIRMIIGQKVIKGANILGKDIQSI